MIARKSVFIMLIQFLNGILGYIGLKFIALYMQPWEYGIVGFAFGFVSLFAIFGKLGFNHAHIKRISEGKDLGMCIGTFIVTKTFLAGLLGSLTILSIAVWRYVIGRGFESPIHEQAVYIMLAYFVLLTLSESIQNTFKARKEIVKAYLPLLVFDIVRTVLTIFIALNGLGPLWLASTYLFGEMFHIGLLFIFFKGFPVKKPTFDYFKDYAMFAMPMAIVVASNVLMRSIDKVFIQLFWGAEQVGEYFAASNISRYLILLATSVGLLLFPTFSKHHANKNIREIKKLVLKSERYLSMMTFPIIVMTVVLAESIIHILLSDKYLPALLVLQIVPFYVLMEVLARPYETKLQGMNMPHITRNRVIIMVILNITLNLILIPRDIQSLGIKLVGLGTVGAAIATVVSYGIGLIYIRIIGWKITGISGSIRIFIHAFAASIMGIILFQITQLFYIARWFHLLGIAFLGAGIYVAILLLLREFTKEDFKLFLDTINLKEMFKYIKGEIKGKK
jgi:O-antigen/teichoic acid export membrane protein